MKTTMSPIAKKHERATLLSFFLFVIPALVLFVLFKWWPIVYSFFLSFEKWNFVSARKFIGLANYARLFTHQNFQKAFVHTFVYIAELFPFFVILPLLFALLLSYVVHSRLQSFFRADRKSVV